MDTLDILRWLLARDASTSDRWDAAGWEAVHRAVAAWDAAPLAFAASRGSRVPPALLAAWRADHTGTTAVNLRLAFEAEALVAALAAEGAPSAPLKGTALFQLGVWRDPGARPTCDVDLLVRPGDAAIVDRALLARGYARTRLGGSKHWPPYVRDGLVVEVHEHAFWSLADGHRVRLAEVTDARGRPTLAAAVAHLVHHLFESSVTTPWLAVKTLADLAEVLTFTEAHPAGGPDLAAAPAATARPPAAAAPPPPAASAPPPSPAGPPDLAADIAATARRFGLERRLGALAGLLARALDRPVPAAWTAAARPGDVDALLRRCAPESGARVEARRVVDRTASFARMPPREKVALLRHYLLPPAEAMRAAYGLPAGSPWVWPLYPLRPLHLIGRSALDAARLLWPKTPGGSGRSRPGDPPREIRPRG